MTKVIEEKGLKKESESNVIAAKKKDSDDLIKRIMAIFEKIDQPIQSALKNEFEKNGMRGPIKKLFDREGWGCDQVNNHFFIFLTSQIEQGRKGQGYDNINSFLIKNQTH